MNFGEALSKMRDGCRVCRSGWNGKDMYVYIGRCELEYPPLKEEEVWKDGVFPESEFIIMKTADKKLIPWLASQTDLLANDWEVI